MEDNRKLKTLMTGIAEVTNKKCRLYRGDGDG